MSDQGVVFDTNGRVIEEGSPFLVFRLSWLAYVSEIWRFLVRFFVWGMLALAVSYGLAALTKQAHREFNWVMLVGVGLAIAHTGYAIALKWSVRVFTDDAGVWMFSGIFPWEKGLRGVQWRDVGEAGYTQGLASWMFRSYSIRVSHRFTQGAELAVRNVHLGNLAVEHVNSVLISVSGRVSRAMQ